MKKSFTLSLLTIMSFSFSSQLRAEVFGKFVDDKKPAQSLSKLISEGKTGDSLVMAQGTVKQVCEKEGCWMTLEDQGKSVRVKFKDHSFMVGKKLIGKKVKTEGVLQKKIQSVAEQKHYLEDAGASKAEIEKIKTPLETYSFEANAVATL